MTAKRAFRTVFRCLLWLLLAIVALVVIIPVALYIPFVQDFAKNIAVEKLSESTGMDISLDRLRLRFPLNLSLEGLAIVEHGDTLIAARSAEASVAALPLFRSRIEIDDLDLSDAYYRLNTPDSATYLTARINSFSSEGTNLGFDMADVNVGRTLLDGADINIIIKDTVTPEKTDTATMRMLIGAPDLRLRNVRINMQMLPTIDTLQATLGNARLRGGKIDLGRSIINADSLIVDSLTAKYLTPSAEFLANYKSPSAAADSLVAPTATSSLPWTINIGHIGLTSPDALYATAGATPLPGLDMSYINVSDVAIRIDSFYNRGTDIRVPIKTLSLNERCGLTLNASGTFEIDSAAMNARQFSLQTNASNLNLDASMGLGDMTKDPSLPIYLDADGAVSLSDIYLAMPTLRKMMGGVPAQERLTLLALIDGTIGDLDINQLKLEMPRYLSVAAQGRVANVMNFDRMQGNVKIDGNISNVDFLKTSMLDPATAKTIKIPPMTIKGNVDYRPGLIDGNVDLRTGSGTMAMDAKWNQRAEGYDLKLKASRFPLQKFMPGLGIADLSARAAVKGHGYDPEKRSTSLKADIDLDHMTYNGSALNNITLTAALDTCRVKGHINSDNPEANIDADLTAWFSKQGYEWDVTGDVRALDLKALGLSTDRMDGSTEIYTNGSFNPRNGFIDAELSLSNLNWHMADQTITVPEATAKVLATDTITSAVVNSGDLSLNARAFCSLDTLMGRLTATQLLLNRDIKDRSIDIPTLQHTLPPLSVDLSSGANNFVATYLAATSGMSFNDLRLTLHNDSLINLYAQIDGFRTGSTRLDQISFNANQKGQFLVYNASVNNQPGTMDDFASVNLTGFISSDRFSGFIKQANIKGDQGFSIGVNAQMVDSTLTFHFTPNQPTIAYKKWQINPDNSVAFNLSTHHLDANLKLMSDSSSLHLYTEHAADSIDHGQEDVILALNNIKLSEWLSLNPFAPPIKGVVDADMRFRWDNNQLTGKGNVNVANLYYGRERVGTFGLDLNLANDPRSGAVRADADLLVDGIKVITASGNLNDSTAVHPFLLDFKMIHFPLRVVNPFLPKDVAQLSGMLNGQMDITGDMANPIFNGFLDFDSTAVKLGMTGMSYAFSEEKIPVDSNIVKFNDFTIAGLNKNDLHINGTVDARRLSNIGLDLNLKARDMQIVNSNRPRGANVYGKAFINLDASAKGNLSVLMVDADLNVLAGTNVTYVMTDGVESLAPQESDDMVRFVQFSDTTSIAQADSIADVPMSIILDARLVISEGSTINVDLSPDGKNKASINGAGSFTYSLNPMDNSAGRLTGRYTINSGFVRYTPQISTGGISMSIMSEKNFKFEEGSYVAFTGDILNPTLNVRAVDRLKANVTQEGQNSRLVNFDITLSVTGTLSNMNVAFDLATNDDLTLENELTSMSAEQRANQAMNLLLYNQYTGPGTKANANLSGNPLYSFLASQLNSWAANNIRGVDISFGIDQYDTTTDGAKSTTTSYSYRVSKSLFNDRFKIVVGGNYSTDADADENFSQNLINDISFEYMLNRSGSMYVRLFRHVGFESILEGEITQTGVGFVLKRKLNSLRDIFRFATRPKEPDPTDTAPAASAPATSSSEPTEKTDKE